MPPLISRIPSHASLRDHPSSSDPTPLSLLGSQPSPASGSARKRLPPFFCILFAVCGLAVLGSLLLALRWSVARDPELAGASLAVSSLSWGGLRASAVALRAIADRHTPLFIATLAAAYLFLQTFAVPGSVLLNALAGVALGSRLGMPLSTLLSATGAAGGYLLSREFGGGLVGRCGWERHMAALRARVEGGRAGSRRERAGLALTLVSLRLFPGTPHWALNIISPHAGVPLGVFWLSAALGMAPFAALAVRGGELIAQTDWADVASPEALVMLSAAALSCAALACCLRRRGDGGGGSGGGGGGGVGGASGEAPGCGEGGTEGAMEEGGGGPTPPVGLSRRRD